MKKFVTTVLMAAAFVAANAQDKLYADEFPLGDVTLNDGVLKKARDLNIHTLLQYDCDRLLAPYRKEAGLSRRQRHTPTGTDSTVMWADTISPPWPSTLPPAARSAASGWNT